MKRIVLWSGLFIFLVGSAGVYFWLRGYPPEAESPAMPEPSSPEPPPIRHPIETEERTAEPLPELSQSDDALRDALAGLFGRDLDRYFNLQDIVHRVVATVDNLPRDNVSPRLMPVKGPPGQLLTTRSGERLTLNQENAARYRPYVRLAEAVPTEALVALYRRFYPLFQNQYEKLGYPGKYFNDRVVDVIDHLLAAPEVDEPVLLEQPKVLYEFVDPKLEKLSAGQKILIRIGRENAARVKSKLREFREALASNPTPSRK
ncbi:MAG TPA: DUF3014 domain-containing protein [Candidatus Eisenbacteria bacterium]|nr:DUF3014 domain-containing protein [Candidatus Eisenbacteria bacterium]